MTSAFVDDTAPGARVPAGLRRLCALVQAMALLGGVGVLSLPVWLLCTPDGVQYQARRLFGMGEQVPMTLDARATALFTAALLPSLAIALYLLWQLWCLFGEYRRGRVFGRLALRHLRRFSFGLLLSALLQPLVRTACILAVTIGNAPGQRQLVIGLSSDDYERVLLAAVLLAIASVMAEAVRVAEDHAGFV